MNKLLICMAVACVTAFNAAAQSFSAATYNIRQLNAKDTAEGNGWERRLPVISSLIRFHDFDIFGAQEVFHSQLQGMLAALPGYDYVGVGRDDGAAGGEYSAIFYKRGRFRLLDSGHFWLSEDPSKPGKGWDAKYVRICTWGRFYDRQSRQRFWFFTTHTDHRGNFNNGYDLAPNSMAAFRKCVELGCVDFIETDVQITKDGQVICLHDNYLKRFTDYSSYAGDEGYVINFTREELRKFRLKTTDGKVTGEQIPTLEEVLTELRGKVWFNLDKCGSDDVDIAKVYEVVKRCGCLDRVQFYVGTNSDRAAWLARQEQPGIIAPHANNASALAAMSAFAPVYMIQTSTGYVNNAWISSLNAKGLSVSNLLDDEGAAFRNGNTVTMDGFVAAGLRMIQCDYPALMDEYLRGKGKR